ncbi:LicD family protein [Eubacterium uniforme]
MLSDVAELYDTNDIRYFLSGGTMLGTVRHKGFIS